MENNPTPPQTPEQPTTPAEAEHGVWISKEEYYHLRKAAEEKPATAAVISSAAPNYVYNADSQKFDRKNFWTYVVAAIALLVFFGVTIGGGPFIAIPVVIGIIFFAVMAIRSLVLSTSPRVMPAASDVSQKRPASAGKVIGIVLSAVIIAMVAPFALMILFFLLLFSTGAAQGS